MAWRPGQRAQERALEAPYEGVPDHLVVPLWEWAKNSLAQRGGRTAEVAIHMRISLSNSHGVAIAQLTDMMTVNTDVLLDIVEALLELYAWDDGRADRLRDLLVAANSAYIPNDCEDGLEMTIVPEVKDQVQAVVDLATGSPGDHLRNAWNEAYGRTPDATKGYSEAIKAVESAMAPVISPTNLKATLGTLIKDVMNKPSKWEFEIADGRAQGVETVLAMMQMLWDGQTSRHGGVDPTREETPEEARAAVHFAATLVQFAVGKSFRLV